MTTTPARLARAGVVLSALVITGITAGLLIGSQAADPASALLVAAAAAVAAAALAAGRMTGATPRRTVTVGHRAREHAEPLSELVRAAHPDSDGRVRSRAPGRSVPAV